MGPGSRQSSPDVRRGGNRRRIDPPEPALYGDLADLGIYTMVGTLGAMDREAADGNPELYRTLLDRGATILSTDRPVEAAEVTASVRDAKTPRDGVFGRTGGR